MGKILERTLTGTAKAFWPVYQTFNRLFPEGKSIQPKWADKPLLKSYQKVKPKLGWPGTTDSLCPECVKEVRADIIGGKQDVEVLRTGKPGEVPAQIVEKDGKILMV